MVKIETYAEPNIYRSKNSYPSFQGLTSKLSKTVYKKEEVLNLCKKYDRKSHGKAGKLPAEWIYCLDFEKRPTAIKDVLNKFGLYFKELREKGEDIVIQEKVSKKITNLFKKNGILKEGEKADVSYIKGGTFSYAYKLAMQGKEYAVKVFDDITLFPSGLNNSNGNLFEQNIFLFLKGKLPKRNNNWGHFFFGDFKNGIMVTKFENEKNIFAGKPYNVEKLGLQTIQGEHYHANNNKGGRIIDSGCTRVLDHAKNKTIGFVYAQTLKDQNAPGRILAETIHWRPSQIKNDRLKGVCYSLPYADKKTVGKCLKLIVKHGDEKVSEYVLQNAHKFNHKDRLTIFNSILEKNSNKLNRLLAQNIDLLDNPTFDMFGMFKKLLKKKDAEINLSLVKNIPILKQEDLKQAFNILYKNSDVSVKSELAKNINILPQKDIPKWFDTLYSCDNDRVLEELSQNIAYLKESEQLKWQTLLMNF